MTMGKNQQIPVGSILVNVNGQAFGADSGGQYHILNVIAGAATLVDEQGGTLRIVIPDAAVTSTLATANAAATLVRRVAIDDGSVKLLRFLVKVQNASGSIYGEFEVKAAYHRVAGLLSSLYAPIVTAVVRSDGGLNVTVTPNGDTDVDLNAVGLAATPLTWTAVEQLL